LLKHSSTLFSCGTSCFDPCRMGCRRAVLLLTLATASGIKVGDMIPDVSLDKGFPPNKVSMREETKGKKVVLVGLPGAFTPT